MHVHLIAIGTAAVLAYSAIYGVDAEQIAEALRPESWVPESAISQFTGLLHQPQSPLNRPIQPNYQTSTSSVPRYENGARAPVSYSVIPAAQTVIAPIAMPPQPARGQHPAPAVAHHASEQSQQKNQGQPAFQGVERALSVRLVSYDDLTRVMT